MLSVMELGLELLERFHARTPAATPSRNDPPSTPPEPYLNAQQTGEAGERAAYFHLRREGYTVVARRWRHAFFDGEIDAIAWEGNTLCFVEVKTRDAATPFAAEFHVDIEKQAVLRRMAAAYTTQLPWPNRKSAPVSQRFDVVSVYLRPNRTHDVRLLRNAFR